jgi:general secretion pathway protein K
VATESIIRNQRGIALVMTLLIVSFLVAMTLQLMMTADRQMTVATNQLEQARLEAMVLGGLQLAFAALHADQRENGFDSTQDVWATMDSERLREISEDIELSIAVSDLSGRLQVNALADGANRAQRELWLRLLLSGRFAVKDQDQAEALLDALIDWLDEDDEQLPQGAENSYYQGLEIPYSCRNGRMNTVEELLLVKGMTPDLVFGNQRHEGLASFVTVVGEDGRINLNTAPSAVLAALSVDMSTELAQDLIASRENEKNREALSASDWYRRVAGFPTSLDLGSDRLTTQGAYFEVRIEAVLHRSRRLGEGVVHRSGQQLTLLSWKQR